VSAEGWDGFVLRHEFVGRGDAGVAAVVTTMLGDLVLATVVGGMAPFLRLVGAKTLYPVAALLAVSLLGLVSRIATSGTFMTVVVIVLDRPATVGVVARVVVIVVVVIIVAG
jgi:hypothetical protein